MFDNSPSDRVQLAGLGELVHPASCMVCGSGNCEEGYVHLGVWFEYEGTMYLCANCTMQVAEVIGCLIPEEALVLKTLVEDTTERLAAVEVELEAAHERLSVYDSVIASASFAVSGTSLDVDPSTGEEPEQPAKSSDSGEPVAEKPVKSSGRSNAKPVESGNGPAIRL